MNYFKHLRRSHFIVSLSIAIFIVFSFLVLGGATFVNRILHKHLISSSIQKAHKISVLNEDFSFERALNSFDELKNIGLFTLECHPIYVTDLLMDIERCKSKDSGEWSELELLGKTVIFGVRDDLLVSQLFQDNTFLAYVIASSVISSIFLAFFSMIFFVLVPSRLVSLEIEQAVFSEIDHKPFPEASNFVLSDIFKSLNKLVGKIIEDRDAIAKSEISRQVAHDLRSPVAVLLNNLNQAHPGFDILYGATQRINQISNSLFTNNYSYCSIDLDKLEEELKEVASSYGLEIVFVKNVSKIGSRISDVDLYRFLSNVLKNSNEVNCSRVEISFKEFNGAFNVGIVDDGPGVPELILEKLNNNIFSTKTNGNGLGLSFIKNKVSLVGGSMSLSNSEGGGFRIDFSFPLLLSDCNLQKLILIDDDKYIGQSWSQKAKNYGIPFAFYRSAETLLADIKEMNPEYHYFVDKNIVGFSGLELIGTLHDLGFTKLFLASGDLEADAIFPDYVISNVGKQFPLMGSY